MGRSDDEGCVWVREIDATADAVEWHTVGDDGRTGTDVVGYAAEWTVPFDAETFASEVVVGAFGSGARAVVETDDRLYEGQTYRSLADRLADDERALRALADRAVTLAERTAGVDVPVSALRRLS